MGKYSLTMPHYARNLRRTFKAGVSKTQAVIGVGWICPHCLEMDSNNFKLIKNDPLGLTGYGYGLFKCDKSSTLFIFTSFLYCMKICFIVFAVLHIH
jgi:hypothetical protein